ncbi:MAG: DUF5518 domain-containing protein [Candidatus Thorarchaeota archaeon]
MVSIPQRTSAERWRIIGLILAAAFLNLGLYFILWIFAPIVSGLVCGYFLRSKKNGALVGFLGGLIAYVPMQLIAAPASFDSYIADGTFTPAELLANLPWLYVLLIIGAIILACGGLFGGYIGGSIGKRIMN